MLQCLDMAISHLGISLHEGEIVTYLSIPKSTRFSKGGRTGLNGSAEEGNLLGRKTINVPLMDKIQLSMSVGSF